MTLRLPRAEFAKLLDGWLLPEKFNDVAENGLQIEGAADVSHVVTGVSANMALLERAVAHGADAVVVHHGLVWGGGIRKLDGWLKKRVELVMRHGINLFAYHLPLDAQPEVGNNAGLAKALGVVDDVVPFGKYKNQLIGLRGRFSSPVARASLVDRVTQNVGAPLAVVGARNSIASIGICTGGAPELLHDAIGAGLDCYITGEITEWVQAVAEESGTLFIAAGHHATERFGPRALAEKLRTANLDATFLDVENPA